MQADNMRSSEELVKEIKSSEQKHQPHPQIISGSVMTSETGDSPSISTSSHRKEINLSSPRSSPGASPLQPSKKNRQSPRPSPIKVISTPTRKQDNLTDNSLAIAAQALKKASSDDNDDDDDWPSSSSSSFEEDEDEARDQLEALVMETRSNKIGDEKGDHFEDEEYEDYEGDEDRCSFVSSESSRVTVNSSNTLGVSDGDSSLFTSSTNAHDAESTKMARREATAAWWGRIAVVSLLLASAGCLIFALFWIEMRNQQESFQNDFESYSDMLGTAWQDNVANLFVGVDTLAVDVSLATTDTTWPFVTLPEYGIYATHLRNIMPMVLSTALSPVVTLQNRIAYEWYVLDNVDWVNATLEWHINATEGEEAGVRMLQSFVSERRVEKEVTFVGSMAEKIYKVDVDSGIAVVDEGSPPFYPIRTIDPILSTKSINYNLASNRFLMSNMRFAHDNSSAVFGPLVNVSETLAGNRSWLGSLGFPVIDSFNGEAEVVGVLSTLFEWPSLLHEILPNHVQGIFCVVHNTCEQSFTLDVSGGKVTMMRDGDHHDPLFSDHGIIYHLADGLTGLAERTISRVPFAEQSPCQYTLTVYPSASTMAMHEWNAKNIVIATAVVFLCVLVIFGCYDFLQERRIRKVKRTAQEARAIVSSLFPANVHDRLLETNRKKRLERKREKHRCRKEKRRRKKAKKSQEAAPNNADARNHEVAIKNDFQKGLLSNETVQQIMTELGNQSANGNMTTFSTRNMHRVVSHPKHRLKTLLSDSSPSLIMSHFGIIGDMTKPIADFFPHTTVLFADIVSFTAWSSEREPEQVFTLLQTLYQSFDMLAKNRKVFKVETIGDCYVAVTGLPDPQQDHAVRMTKFARECLTMMAEVTKKLEISLGPDTGDLSLRIGMNSGPVTAGVLIGDKSRFQLFGDTVNTASRMESTGEPDRIQVSATTAELLKEAGKTYWVRPREEQIHAKGKGLIQTFWIMSKSNTGSIMEACGRRGASELGNGPTRVAPGRTRSSLVHSIPARGIQRATSENLSNAYGVSALQSMASSQQGDKVDREREERLVQWQVELCTKLLKNIVAARAEKSSHKVEIYFEDDLVEGEVVPLNETPSAEFSLPSVMRKRKDQYSWPGPNRRSFAKQGDSERPPKQAPSTITSRKASLRSSSSHNFASTNISLESGPVSLLGSSFGDLSFSLTVDSQIVEETPNNDADQNNTYEDKIVVDEVAEVIALPHFTPKATKASTMHQDDVILEENVTSQLKDYIATIAHMYRKNPFHNFEHASHVTMSATKLLNRIVVPENIDYTKESGDVLYDLHGYTYGISHDPLTHFAVVFSALVHDVDHNGVPNAQLAKENPEMAELYRNKSIAEQNSVDLAWDLLLDPMYKDLQNCIAVDEEEKQRFRQLVVNSVMATDIFDKDMKELRNKRWNKAFHNDESQQIELNDINMEEYRNMRATIVIEHIIQASDVAHTMQHWHIYTKWNERLFEEMYSAYECGRADKNPAQLWYKGELWFFDNYVIPLAKKLEECNVFGVASDECLNYATANRNEWQAKGEEMVAQMEARYQKKSFFVTGRAKQRAPNRKDIIKPKQRSKQPSTDI